MRTKFKVGDAIVIPSRGNGIFHFNALFSEKDIAEARRATPEEIKAGYVLYERGTNDYQDSIKLINQYGGLGELEVFSQGDTLEEKKLRAAIRYVRAFQYD